MSIYSNEKNELYPNLNYTAPSREEINQQHYQIVKVSKVAAYFQIKIAEREKLAINMKWLAITLNAIGTRLIIIVVVVFLSLHLLAGALC